MWPLKDTKELIFDIQFCINKLHQTVKFQLFNSNRPVKKKMPNLKFPKIILKKFSLVSSNLTI